MPFKYANCAPCALQVLRHFSYEHFYVIYCKFWDVDTGG